MTSLTLRWLLIGLLLLVAGVAHAEGECPPGMFPTNPPGTQGPVGCAPIPGYNNQQQTRQQPPPSQWISRWGAIATDFAHSAAGASVDQPSKDSAERSAIANCQSNGGVECKIETWYSNGCAVMLVGTNHHVSVNAATTLEAVQDGMKICKKDGVTDCHIYYSACSPPVRIQ